MPLSEVATSRGPSSSAMRCQQFLELFPRTQLCRVLSQVLTDIGVTWTLGSYRVSDAYTLGLGGGN